MSPSAPRMPSSTGARLRCVTGILTTVGSAWVAPMAAQEPPDSVIIPDSLAAADSLSVADSLLAELIEPDSLSADTIFYNMPTARGGIPAGFATGVWEWDRHLIMASGANTLAELFQQIPGLISLAGGDYGTPLAMSAFGQGGGGYRIIRDGLEVYPVDGGVTDLQRVGLAGISRVRLDRSLGQMIVEMWSHEYDDGRPFSVIEAGTGDLDTNMFRGVYADPTALLGSLAGGLERLDSRSIGVDEGGNRTGTWFRYQLHAADRAAIGFELRQMGSQTKVDRYVPKSTRRDVVVRAGVRLFEGVTLEAYTGRTRYEVDIADEPNTALGGTRAQHGGRLGIDLGQAWANGSFRRFEGDLPARQLDAEGGLTLDRAGAAGRVSMAEWNGRNTTALSGRAWLGPVGGITLFGAYENGDFGSRVGPVSDGPDPGPVPPREGLRPGVETIVDRETLRLGAVASRWGVTLGGAVLQTSTDLFAPFATELDLGSPLETGGDRLGYEGTAAFPTMWEGLTLEGSVQYWDEEGPYLPATTYRGSFEFHRVYKETENLEFWASAGVRGHDPMMVFEAGDGGTNPGGLTAVPFYQSWYFRIQVRVVTVRLYLGMDNFTFRRNLQNYPDRLLPYARSFFALRWDMWN